jgi:hypothetical protein
MNTLFTISSQETPGSTGGQTGVQLEDRITPHPMFQE